MDKPQVDDELAHATYWDQRYKDAIIDARNTLDASITSDESNTSDESRHGEDLETYDWFRTWEHLDSWIRNILLHKFTQPRVLHLGCGNSTLTADLHNIGLTDQTNIDFSEVVIRGMRTKYEGLGARWEVMDVRDLKFEPHSFDIAIDKATMDSMFYGSMWDPPDEVRQNIKTYLNEVERVLVPQGLFLYITYRQPHFIRPLLARDTWTLKHEVIPDRGGGVFEYFAYTMEKHASPDAEQKELTGHEAAE